MRAVPAVVLYILAACAGLFFSTWSAMDFVQHLDRQVHSLHCSFIPGLTAADSSVTSGCHVAMMSTWSSVMRGSIWGGLPITLPAMAVFAFLLFRGVEFLVNRRWHDRWAAFFLAGAAVVPVLTSVFYGFIAFTELEALCKLCMGIYLSSFTLLASGAAAMLLVEPPPKPLGRKPRPRDAEDDAPDEAAAEALPGSGTLFHVAGFFEGVGFVVVPSLLYFAMVPDFSSYIGQCGTLPKPDDTAKILVPIGESHGGKASIEVFDPLCPACKGFETRLRRSGLDAELDRKALLFPLDSTCNWMIGSTLHAGACTISEAILCADKDADAIIDWAFAHQEEIRTGEEKEAGTAKKLVEVAFPKVKGCVGSHEARQRLNQSLRWAVANQLPVLTPQLYVDGVKLCDEDTDLGLEWALGRLIEQGGQK